MGKRIKQYIYTAMILGAAYFFLSRHILFYGKDYYLLNKEELTLEYTFYSIAEKAPETIMEIDPLRRAGVGQILVDLDIITDDERYDLEEYYEYEAEEQ